MIRNEKHCVKLSKFLSLVLRHKPEVASVTLDGAGWASTAQVVQGCQKFCNQAVTESDVEYVVKTNNKKRFEFSADGLKIRASQGHSIDSVELGYKPQAPPELLYHGTAAKNLQSILTKGLLKCNRQHVHLSNDVVVAVAVGQRRGEPIVLTVFAQKMYNYGYEFFLSTNGVWLTKYVSPEYLSTTRL